MTACPPAAKYPQPEGGGQIHWDGAQRVVIKTAWMMLAGKRVKITRHRLEVLRKGLLTEQATMKSPGFVFSTPHATYLETD